MKALATAKTVKEAENVLQQIAESGADSAALAQPLAMFLSSLCDHPRFRRWLAAYYGGQPLPYQSRLQQPSFLYYPLPGQPWFDSSVIDPQPSRETLAEVRQELAAFVNTLEGKTNPYVAAEAAQRQEWQELAGSSNWSSLHLIQDGLRQNSWLDLLPKTAAFLENMPLCWAGPHAPECFLSIMQPGVRLPEHFGLSNIKLTAHLPVILPSTGCELTAGNVTHKWQLDELMIFDDSFWHTAQNLSNTSRVVLIFDIWHPALSPGEKEGLAAAIHLMNKIHTLFG